jgi:hypothetical protein
VDVMIDFPHDTSVRSKLDSVGICMRCWPVGTSIHIHPKTVKLFIPDSVRFLFAVENALECF